MWCEADQRQRQRIKCGNGELTNKQKNWYRIRVFGDDRHRDDLPRAGKRVWQTIRKADWFYTKVGVLSGFPFQIN